MRLSIKMYLIIFISASVILYQYHLSNAWLISQTTTQDFRELNSKSSEKLNTTPLSDVSSSSIATASRHNKSILYFPPQEKKTYLPPLYIITPTYRRPEQLAELTRLSHTLMLLKNIYWIVIEDAAKKSPLVTNLLQKTGITYEHLIAPMPEKYKKKKGIPKPRGVSNRNRGLKWIRENAKTGVLYFADDDNTYDLQLFDEIRYTKKVSMFPVGLITRLGVSSPIVKNGVFAGFYDGWVAGRKFPVDMAGFAISVDFLLRRPKASMPFNPGFEEDGFLKSLEPFEPRDIELLASNCTQILVWHTQTKKNEPSQSLDVAKYNNTNLVMLKKILV